MSDDDTYDEYNKINPLTRYHNKTVKTIGDEFNGLAL